MDLSKSKLEIIKIEGPDDLGFDILDIFHIMPEKEHIGQLGSGQFSVEEGKRFECPEEDLYKYDDIMSQYELDNELELEKAYQSLEEEGFSDLGLMHTLKIFKKIKRESEYILILRVDIDNIISIAASGNRRLLQQYKKVIDNPVTRFKIGLIATSNPDIIMSLADMYQQIKEDSDFCHHVLEQLNLIDT